jgi:hypothetical protein
MGYCPRRVLTADIHRLGAAPAARAAVVDRAGVLLGDRVDCSTALPMAKRCECARRHGRTRYRSTEKREHAFVEKSGKWAAFDAEDAFAAFVVTSSPALSQFLASPAK